uniref:Reverse transcriptase/retrotransposon-derived protein RNase H-like domain-containing protein n=1 Tax=Dromaius novaehollandiae TaxID=8790 RepID=A0A8C4P4X8_DRONO
LDMPRPEIEPLAWGPEREKAFTSVKKALVSAPALGLPDYSKLFELFVHERQGVVSGVLTQKLGPHRRPVAYYSTQLDEVAKGTPGCIRAIAATAALIEKTRPVVLGHSLTVYVSAVLMLLFQTLAMLLSLTCGQRTLRVAMVPGPC